jgi:hypothetical protein
VFAVALEPIAQSVLVCADAALHAAAALRKHLVCVAGHRQLKQFQQQQRVSKRSKQDLTAVLCTSAGLL